LDSCSMESISLLSSAKCAHVDSTDSWCMTNSITTTSVSSKNSRSYNSSSPQGAPTKGESSNSKVTPNSGVQQGDVQQTEFKVEPVKFLGSHETVQKRVSSKRTFYCKLIKPTATKMDAQGDIRVVAPGTKLMAKINCPTVIVELTERTFCKARVHYVVLQPLFAENAGQITALLLSNPYHPGGRLTTRSGELFPLLVKTTKSVPTLSPMLLDPSYQNWFKIGCAFRFKFLKVGRAVDGPSLLRQPQLLTRQILGDIQKIPMEAWKIKKLQPFKGLKQMEKPEEKRGITRENRSSIWLENLSDSVPDLRLRGLRASGGHRDFARWFKAIPPDVAIDKDFRCDCGIFKKDMFSNLEMLDRYLGLDSYLRLSDII